MHVVCLSMVYCEKVSECVIGNVFECKSAFKFWPVGLNGYKNER